MFGVSPKHLLVVAGSINSVRASISLSASYPGVTYSPKGTNYWTPYCPGPPQPCFDGCAAYFGSQTDVFTFAFPSASSSWQWWGYQTNNAGMAQCCFDGATSGSGCHIASYYNATTNHNTDPPRLLFSITGLSNTIHNVKCTNIADTNNGNQYGEISVDHFVIDGTPATRPTFPKNTFLTNVPTLSDANHAYWVNLTLGQHSPALQLLLDAGANGAYAFGSQCTGSYCSGHNLYVPSSQYHNLSVTDTICYGDGSDCSSSYRGNDTVTFGNVTSLATYGSLYKTTVSQPYDGNFGIAKAYWYGGACVNYPNFVELAYLNGAINAPVLSWFEVLPTDNAASGVTSVAQLGGVDRNKYTGSIDWIPLTQASAWESPSQVRSVRTTTNGAIVSTTWTYPVIRFDTGDGGILALPTSDWNVLTAAVGAIQDSSSGNWYFPCQSTITLMMHGSTGRSYVVPLAYTNQPYASNSSYCLTTTNDEGSSDVWLMGVPFLHSYYLSFHYQANLMGFATKNVASNAATSAVVIGQA